MTTHEPVHFGFKQITQENWLRPDLPTLFPDVTPELWLGEVLKPRLAPKVPEEVQALFECARSLFVYGFLFYPLSTLAAEHLHRVAEAAASAKCRVLRLPATKPGRRGKRIPFGFSDNIARLKAAGLLPKAEAAWWNNTRKLRNRASHPQQQAILPPGMMLGVLHNTAARISQLFQ